MSRHPRLGLVLGALLMITLISACSSPGPESPSEVPAPAPAPEPAETPEGTEAPQPAETPAATETTEAAETPEGTEAPQPAETPASAESAEPAQTTEPAAPAETPAPSEPGISTQLTSDPVTLVVYIEPNFPYIESLGAEFMRQYPNVEIEYRKDPFANLMENSPRLLASDDPPDIVATPSLIDLVKNDLLLNLDPYAAAYGWDAWPQSIYVGSRVDSDGIRGTGPLYGVGLGYQITGVFYNRTLATQIGMTEPPESLAELDALLATAKEMGLQPIIGFNTPVGGTAFPYQAVLNQYVQKDDMNDWIYQRPGAVFNSPKALEGTEHFNRWVEAGYFQPDVNAIDYVTHLGQFTDGEGVFMFNGDWESANIGGKMGDNVGFFLAPPLEAGAPYVAMSKPGSFSVAAASRNADAAVFFLDWAHTDPTARRIIIEENGQNPGGPPDLPIPVTEGTLVAETIAAGPVLGADDGAVDFIANATGSILAEVMTPELQKLVAGRQTPQGLIDAIQAEYEDQLDR